MLIYGAIASHCALIEDFAGVVVTAGHLEQGVSLPVVGMMVVGGGEENTLEGGDGFIRHRMRFSCFAETLAQAATLRRLIRRAMRTFVGPFEDLIVEGAYPLKLELDDHNPDTGTWRCITDFYVVYKEE